MFLERLVDIILLVLLPVLVHLAYPCQQDEICIKLYRCPHLFDSIYIKPRGIRMDILKNRQCGKGFKGSIGNMYICCPHPGNILPTGLDCGQGPPINRIKGGRIAHPNEYPWMAMLLYVNQSAPHLTSEPRCAGSLINNRYVVTAAHCVLPVKKMRNLVLKTIRLGEHDTSQNPDCHQRQCAPPYLESEVKDALAHPNYNEFTFQNDIALVRLKIIVRYTNQIQPICLPNYTIPLTHSLSVAGWGTTDQSSTSSTLLLHAMLKERSLNVCPKKYAYRGFENSTQICAGGLDDKGTCEGDSGGPLMVTKGRDVNTAVYLAGITSYSAPCSINGWPIVFTRTEAFYHWIKMQLLP